MAKTLIAYVSKGGVTGEYANVIAGVLREKYGLVVDVVDVGKNHSPDISGYRNVVVGSGVRMQRVYGEALKFLDQELGDRKVALFISTMEVDEKARPEAENKYIKNTLAIHPNLEPVATTLFGGRMKMLGRTTGDFTDMSKASAWADELGSKLEK